MRDLPAICVVGPGLIGGSLAMAARQVGHPVTVLCRSEEEAAGAQSLGLAAVDPAAVVPQAGWVFVATPVTAFDAQFRRIAPHLGASARVSDVGSTKRSAHRLAREVFGPGKFLGSHPMAGSEKKGLAHARADLFRRAACILTDEGSADVLAGGDDRAWLTAFWEGLGCRVSAMDPDTHDRLLASVSHLPHLLAACLVLAQPEGAIPLAGGGFRDATRVAGGDAEMWSGILMENAENVMAALQGLEAQTRRVRELLATRDSTGLHALLAAARAARSGS